MTGMEDHPRTRAMLQLTLNVSNSGREKVLLELGVRELLEDVGLDGLDEVRLLRLALLLLEADPRVEDSFGLGGEGRLLLEDKVLGLELGGLLLGGGMAEGEVATDASRGNEARGGGGVGGRRGSARVKPGRAEGERARAGVRVMLC